MIEKNIFRPLPSVKKNNLNFAETGMDAEEEMDPTWPHIQGVYEFFLQLVISENVEVRSLKVYVTPQFVQEFLDLFDSEESVERDYLKNILHKLYAKVSISFRVCVLRRSTSTCYFLVFKSTLTRDEKTLIQCILTYLCLMNNS